MLFWNSVRGRLPLTATVLVLLLSVAVGCASTSEAPTADGSSDSEAAQSAPTPSVPAPTPRPVQAEPTVIATATAQPTMPVSDATADEALAPPNDLAANATVIDVADLPFADSIDTTTATSDSDDESADCPAPTVDASVWYSITPSTDVRLKVGAEGSDYPAGVSAVAGEPGGFELLECRPFAFDVVAEAGVTYYFQVFDGDDPGAQGGNLEFTVEEVATDELEPLGQEFVDLVAGEIDVSEGAFMFAVVGREEDPVVGSNGVDEAGNPPTADDVFRVGSITKVFTALATLTLVDDGVVDLDAPASQYVSRVVVPADVTVRDLLSHTSGIANYTDADGFFPSVYASASRVWAPEELVALVAEEPSQFEPGSEFGYSNTNYVILGILIEEATGQDYHDIIRMRLIEPYGLSSTYLAGFETGLDPFDPYEHEGAADYDYTSIATSAWAGGALVSSAGDLHALFTALFDGRIISTDLVEQMIEGDEYGLGMQLYESDQGLFGHSGGIDGYATFLRHSPELGITLFQASTDPVADPSYAHHRLFEGFAALAAE